MDKNLKIMLNSIITTPSTVTVAAGKMSKSLSHL